jgi:hypothetical protein
MWLYREALTATNAGGIVLAVVALILMSR